MSVKKNLIVIPFAIAAYVLWQQYKTGAAISVISDKIFSLGKKMKTSQRGIDFIKQREGVRYTTYYDSVGKKSIGVGHLILPHEFFPAKIDDATATSLLLADLSIAENCINANVKVTLSQHQFDALSSFIFNIGVGAFKKSTMLQKINAQDLSGAADEFIKWTKQKELTSRRISEKKQFMGVFYAD